MEFTHPDFHSLSLEEKINLYTSQEPDSIFSKNYQKYLLDYEHQKTREVIFKYREGLEHEHDPNNPDLPKYTPQEIRKMVRAREREFKANELPGLMTAYRDHLLTEIHKAILFINTRPLFLNFTLYDILQKIKNEKNIALFSQKALLALDHDLLQQFAKDVIFGLLKDFYEYNRPVENFMSSVDVDHSGATWLSHTVHPLIHGFGPGMPMKDQISIIAIIESFQAIERLLITENRFDNLMGLFLPFLKAISATHEEERSLKFIHFLHSGQFTDGHHESKELMTQLSPLINSAIQSGLLNDTLQFGASLGQESDVVTRFLSFLTFSSPKQTILKFLNPLFSQNDPFVLQEKIKYAIHTYDHPQDWDSLETMLLSLTQKEKLNLPHTRELLSEPNPERPITPVIQTLEELITHHDVAFELFLSQLGEFLSQDRNALLIAIIQKYRKHQSQHNPPQHNPQSLLTQMIKQDQIQPFLKILLDMLQDNSFRLTGHLMKDLIDRGELEKSLDLLVKLLLIQGGSKI